MWPWKWIGKAFVRNKLLRNLPFKDSSRKRSSIPFPLVELPADLKRSVANFLCGQDVLRLCRTCRKICSDVGLTVRPPFQILGENSWIGEGESPQSPRIATVIPNFHGSTHSIILDCECYDEEAMMKFYIVAHHNQDYDLRFSSGSILEELEVRRCGTRLQLSFRPRHGKIHYLWYQMTSRPGGISHVSALRVYALVYN